MAAGGDGNGIAEVDLGPAVVVVHRHGGKAAQHVQLGDGLRGLLDAGGFGRHGLPQLGEKLVFERDDAVLGREDGAFELLELLGDVALAGGERLLADIGIGDEAQLPLGDFDVIAEHAVIAHAEIPDAGLFLLPRLDLREHALAAGLDGAQVVKLLVCSVADETALAQQEGRIVDDGPVDLLLEIRERVELLIDALQIRRAHPGQALFDLRQRGRALRQRGQIPARGRAGHDAGHGALKIGDLAQRQQQLLAVDGLFDQLLNSGQTARDLRGAEQRPLHPRAQQTAAHGGLRLVEDPEKAPALFLAAHRLRQLEIPPGSKIELHEFARNIELQLADVRQIVLLQIPQRQQQRTGRQRHARKLRQAKLLRAFAELRSDRGLTQGRVKLRVFAEVHAGVEALAQQVGQRLILRRRTAEERFGRQEAAKLVLYVLHRVGSGDLRGAERAGRYVAEAQAVSPRRAVDAGIIIVFRLHQHRAFRHGAGRHDADDVALDEPLGQRRVLHLLADGDLVALGDEAGDIALGGMIGHAAHGDLVLGAFVLGMVARGERQIELARSDPRVLLEHLIKIPQPEKQQAVRIAFLDRIILLHHRGELSHNQNLRFSLSKASANPYIAKKIFAVRFFAQIQRHLPSNPVYRIRRRVV